MLNIKRFEQCNVAIPFRSFPFWPESQHNRFTDFNLLIIQQIQHSIPTNYLKFLLLARENKWERL